MDNAGEKFKKNIQEIFVMSKKNQKALEANAPAGPQTVVTEKKAAIRLFSFLFLLVSVAALALLPYAVATFEGTMPIYQAVLNMVTGGWILNVGGTLTNIGYSLAIYLFAVALVVAAIASVIALFTAKRTLAVVASILVTVGAVVYTACYAIAAGGLDIVSLVLAIAMIVATIVCVIFTKPLVEVIEEEVEKEEEGGFEVEEYAEAYPYEGGPVAGVVMAEEVNPSFLPHEPHVNTAGYDFYNSKSFDAFIATLSVEERNQFTELFILRFQGTMPELPEYQVGGDNKEFFRKVFIYLGQYRDRIPSGLLGKMYQYSLKLN